MQGRDVRKGLTPRSKFGIRAPSIEEHRVLLRIRVEPHTGFKLQDTIQRGHINYIYLLKSGTFAGDINFLGTAQIFVLT